MSDPQELTILRVGAQGDGVANGAVGPVFIPFTLAGERVRADVTGERGRLIAILAQSPDRTSPVCRHFGTCGGCALQHMAPDVYKTWKRDQIVAAFLARGIDANVERLIAPIGLRRRAVLTALRTHTGVTLGFHESGSHSVVDLHECPVLDRQIVSALPGLRRLVAPLMARLAEVRLTVTQTRAGLDIAVDGIARKLTPDVRIGVAAAAAASRFARVSFAGDPVYQALPPFLRFGSADVLIPPGVFVQANEDAEAQMAVLLVAALAKSKSVADLFSGIGAFTFPLAAKARVSAFDSDKTAIDALTAGVKTATGIKPVAARVRDLFREPLSATELNEFDAVVFDPPRAGAETQARMLAKSKVKIVLAVSCNPATLARDARLLIDGGYTLEAVTPIDQFHYTPHVEAVAVFRR